ncbi:pyridoxamine 5'-phosphate oxidase family protein [Phytoactinopolyspora limicola]|uniref:pyridoxamine 5'-phosphate oxidase family protein n=1 Tax=Phytoactinopolyspora limicola TaxID=2715536 RepID=UPI00140786D5|nr:pyridoxamine 5'-phosphate oxidase family protein [Phytoactinopolyspora limicola]
MGTVAPATTLDERFSDPDAQPVTWSEALRAVATAELSWISTVRSDGRPHVTPLLTVWHEGGLHFCTGPGEQKAMNLRKNAAVTLTTGTNTLHGGLDVVVEGTAVRITDRATLSVLAEEWVTKYGEEWRFEADDAGFRHPAGPAWVYVVHPVTAFGFAKQPYGQTRWRFGSR